MMTFVMGILVSSASYAEPALKGACPLQPGEERAILDCLKAQSENECSELKANTRLKDKLETCHVSSVTRDKQKQADEVILGCGRGVRDHIIQLFDSIAAIPKMVQKGLRDTKEARLVAAAICNQKKQNDPNFANMTSCLDRETVNVRNVHIPWEEYQAAIRELRLKAFCLKPEYRAEVICPIALDLATLFSGGAIVQSGRAVVKNALKGISKIAAETESRFLALSAKATTSAEKKSLLHQKDLVSLGRNPQVYSAASELGFDMKALERGMIDSDMGKLASVRNQFVNGSSESREFIRVLQGKNSGQEGRAFRKILDEAGFQGKTFLPAHLTEEQIEMVFKNHPIMGGYLHELPGMQAAIRDLRTLKISQTEFERRIKANLFHNGPQAGFWDDLTQKYVPGALKSGGADAQSFLKGTVFEGSRYPAPISPEGILHTIGDRLSQGTAGGISKIYDEVAGKSLMDSPKIKLGDLKIGPDDGLTKYSNLLGQNLTDTKKQLKVLGDRIDTLEVLNPAQREFLSKMNQNAMRRIDKEAEFFRDHVTYYPSRDQINRIDLEFTDSSGIQRRYSLNRQTPADEAQRLMDQFLRAEEKHNGHPFDGIKVNEKTLTAEALIVGGAVQIPLELKCPMGITSKTNAVPSESIKQMLPGGVR